MGWARSNLRPPTIWSYGDALALIQRGTPLRDEPNVTPLTQRRRRDNLVAVYEGDRISVEYGHKTMATFHKDGWIALHHAIDRNGSPEANIAYVVGRQGVQVYADRVGGERCCRVQHEGRVCFTERRPVRVHAHDPVDLNAIATLRVQGVMPNAAKTKAYLKDLGWYEFAAWADMRRKIEGEKEMRERIFRVDSHETCYVTNKDIIQMLRARDVAQYDPILRTAFRRLGEMKGLYRLMTQRGEMAGDDVTLDPVMTNAEWHSFFRRARRIKAIPV